MCKGRADGLRPVLSATPAWLPLVFRSQGERACSLGSGGCSPGAWLFMPLSQRAWRVSVDPPRLSLGVMHGFICHLPAADLSSSFSPLPVHPPALSLSCHHPSRNSALFWHLLCSDHSIFCIFSVFRCSVKLFPSFTELYSPISGSSDISAEILRYGRLWNGFLSPLTLPAFHSNSAAS